MISGTTAPGTATVTATIAGGTKYKPGIAGKYTVEFTKREAPKLTFIEPQWVNFGTKSSAPASPTGYDEATMGAIIYKVTSGTASDGATIDGDGRVHTTKVGKVVVTATTNGGTHYAAGKIGTFTVTVQKMWVGYSTIGQITSPTSVPLGGTSEAPNTENLSEKYGKLSFKRKYNETGDNTTVDPNTGEVRGAEYAGTVIVVFTTAGNDRYEPSDPSSFAGEFAVMFTETQVSFSNPPNVTVGTKSDAPTMTGSYDEGEYNTIQYQVTGGTASDGAIVDGDGKVTATKAGTVIVEDFYAYSSIIPLGSYTVTVTE